MPEEAQTEFVIYSVSVEVPKKELYYSIGDFKTFIFTLNNTNKIK